ncbi:TetR/AcrR family transcriptional regulator [Dactylosporangium sucinum]|uniref:TetR family transcriptional regulator n=1 Tax=Dactylosporangium sucinum TaxID=1424081 RepID=A0A917UFI0_9ACTN|nr:TetR/AcrR family transcriptional regulator [Dactylosporangium sucinum]GGM89247.1 TetR family transcriptional regulator [Dactylosporangium sucinum]
MPEVGRPVRGTRPTNRRALILDAATALFAERGYENVAMGDIAEVVAVGPSALYRHFPGKAELLVAAIGEVAAELIRRTEGAESLRSVLVDLAAYSVEHRFSAVLWQRESRQLPAQLWAPVRDHLRAIRDHVAAAVLRERPRLALDQARALSVATLGALFSPSFHHTSMASPGFEERLVEVASRVADVDVPPAPAPVARRSGLTPASRREDVLAAAMRLFAERTYASVGMEEIAQAAGMATSSVYLHFSGKAEILWVALQRGTGYLQLTSNEVLAMAPDERSALDGLVAIYAQFAMRHPELVDALITEIRSLGAEETAASTMAQREYVAEWVHLYRRLHPGAGVPAATITVQAALMVVNDLARTPAFRSRSDAADVAAALSRAALGLS